MKKVRLKEFQARGYLQEANRLFFHPLGMALTFKKLEKGNVEYLCIADYRKEPGGYMFEDLSDNVAKRKSDYVNKKRALIAKERMKKHGFIIQPIGHKF